MNTSTGWKATAIAAVAAVWSVAGVIGAEANSNCGKASWYALHSKTASGERMKPALLTAAHRKLRFGTRVKVTNQRNGKSVVVRINDRGPFIRGRVLDLSKGAAREVGMLNAGVTKICYEIVD